MANPDTQIAAMHHPVRKAGDHINHGLNKRTTVVDIRPFLPNLSTIVGRSQRADRPCPTMAVFSLFFAGSGLRKSGCKPSTSVLDNSASGVAHPRAMVFRGTCALSARLKKKIEGFPL
jgi:hypothetical protein